jgi:hypothetical protein
MPQEGRLTLGAANRPGDRTRRQRLIVVCKQRMTRSDGTGAPNVTSQKHGKFPVLRDSRELNSLLGRINSLFRLRREFSSKLLESRLFFEAFWAQTAKVSEIPVLFPVCREFGPRRSPPD